MRVVPNAAYAIHDRETSDAANALARRLPPEGAERLGALLDAGRAAAERSAYAMLSGRGAAPVQDSSPSAEALVQEAAGEDPEAGLGDDTSLQRAICAMLDAANVDSLARELAATRRWTDIRRLRELRDESVSPDWLWAINFTTQHTGWPSRRENSSHACDCALERA